MASPANYFVGYNFQPGDTVWVIESNTVKKGTVRLVDINVNDTTVIIKYWIQIDGELSSRAFDEANVYATCRAASAYQDIEFNIVKQPTDLAFEQPVYGTPKVVFIIDGMMFTLFSALDTTTATIQDVVNEINSVINPYGTATLMTIGNATQRSVIRVMSATTGSSSSVEIYDGGVVPGSPLTIIGSPL